MIRNIVFAAVLGTAVWAQSPVLNGTFILAEESKTSASLGLLTFDGAGNVSGTQYVQASGIMQSMAVTGAYAIVADGSGTLTLNTQVPTEDGPAPAVSAVYEFLRAKAGGFVAIRRDTASATLAEITPASKVTSFNGVYLLTDESISPSGQSVAELGLLTMKADGSLSGRLVIKQNSSSETKVVQGSYALESSGFGNLKLSTPSAADEDGGVVMESTAYVYLVAANGEWVTLRTDNALPGLARIEPLQ